MNDIKIHILVGDITTINADVIVNAANSSLLGGSGVDGAILQAGGNAIRQECQELRNTKYPNGLPIGEAVMTNAGNLKAKYIIHTVGPKYKSDPHPEESLIACYKNSLLLADQNKCTSIAFPAIATGIYAYPKEEAARIAYDTLNSISNECKYVKDIIFVFFYEADAVYIKNYINEEK